MINFLNEITPTEQGNQIKSMIEKKKLEQTNLNQLSRIIFYRNHQRKCKMISIMIQLLVQWRNQCYQHIKQMNQLCKKFDLIMKFLRSLWNMIQQKAFKQQLIYFISTMLQTKGKCHIKQKYLTKF
ncbi:unnamed protein product [Paramecium pentaurelia]|uniref:Uncharacterized protein n=1 Tax=Paramecium pentaurelia TaxID=43138 RepID=A0A8S1XAJ2_9CILI|nr:unnamed protein product [Paramecium pentaurelia]